MGFVVSQELRNDDVVAEGSAIGTDPGAQQRAQRGSTVTLYVSLGPKMTQIPSVVGGTEAEANAALKAAGFTVGAPTRTNSDTIPKGQVTSSDPQAGETVRHDSVITLTVSDGPASIKIPKVIGLTLADAQVALAADALVVTVVHERTEEAAAGIVFKQDPAPDVAGLRTDPITITVSDGPPLVEVPDVRGKKFPEARKELTDAGFAVDGKDEAWNFSKVVFTQTPAPKQMAERGSTVFLSY